MERESSLERSRAQLEVDWQRRCEDSEREVYSKQEQLVVSLTKQRDEVWITMGHLQENLPIQARFPYSAVCFSNKDLRFKLHNTEF